MINVLIVEDDPMVAELNRRYLEKVEGFSLAAIVSNGEEALAYLQDNQVDLVLLDVFMSGMNGLDLLAAIRQQQYGVDVILVTAARDKESVQAALRQGAVDYLIKPFEFERFQASLLAFKQRADFIENQEHLCQEGLDEQVFYQSRIEKTELPKGLDRHTLQNVWSHIMATQGEFTAEIMAGLVGISQVSIRKYLKYLETMDLLNVTINYGAVGRPISKYRRTKRTSQPVFME